MMRSPRVGAALLLAIGIAVGSLTDRVPERPPLRAGDYWLLAADFHVHVFPGDGVLAHWALRREAARAGLDAFAITSHNNTTAARFGQWLGARGDGPIVIAGEEITNRGYHLAAVGLQRTVRGDQPAASAVAEVHAQGGVAIAAHPSLSYWPGLEDALTVLDGGEIAHPAIHSDPQARGHYAAFFNRGRAAKATFAAIGSSDFHGSPGLALCRTYVFARERTAAAIIEAVRSGRTVAEDAEGKLYGDPDLVAIVGRQRPAGRTDPHPWIRRVSITAAWLGLLGLVLLRV